MSWIENYGEDYFQGIYLRELQIDEAYLNFTNKNIQNSKLFLFSKHKECKQCDFHSFKSILQNDLIAVKTAYYYQIIRDDAQNNSNILCKINKDLGEFGIYNVILNENICDISVVKEPVNIYLPILVVFFIYLGMLFLLGGIYYGYKSIFKKKNNSENNTNSKETSEKTNQNRIKAIDTFRGITIVMMIFVNLGAGGYEILDHAVWNGLHMADLIFPCFLWIMGVCMPISLRSSYNKNLSTYKLFENITKRSLKLFLIGIFLNSGVYLDTFRYFAVLQRFGISYFVVSIILIFVIGRNIISLKENRFKDFFVLIWGWLIILLIAIFHYFTIFNIADQGCPKGYLGPGGYHKHRLYENCTGGATGYIDRLIMGTHTFSNPTCKVVYNSQSFDPEGILGTLNAIVQVFFGVQAGTILISYKNHEERIVRWILWAILLVISGGVLCGFSIEDGFIPINKNLWSLSFVLVTSGLAFLFLTVVYILTDHKRIWNGSPFLYAGMNSILLYIGHQITANNFPFAFKLSQNVNETHFSLLSQNVTASIIWLLISYYLYKIKYFLVVY